MEDMERYLIEAYAKQVLLAMLSNPHAGPIFGMISIEPTASELIHKAWEIAEQMMVEAQRRLSPDYAGQESPLPNGKPTAR